MFQRRPIRTAPRSRSMAVGAVLAAVAVVGGGTVVAVNAPTDAGDILLAQNSAPSAPQTLPLGVPVNLDLEPVVARAAGGAIPAGTTVQVTGLPDGIAQDGWVISGTPTRAGEYDVLVTVSNSGVSRSQTVTILVVDEDTEDTEDTVDSENSESGALAARPGESDEPTSTTDELTTDESGSGDEADTDVAPATADPIESSGLDDETTTVEPTLSAAPGARAQQATTGVEDGLVGAADTTTDEEGADTDLCSVVEGGQLDGASLAQLLPTGGEDAAAAGLVTVLLNAVLSLLPSVLGEDGPLGTLSSAGRLMCTVSPSLLGSASASGAGEGTDEDTTGGAAGGTQGLGGADLVNVLPVLAGLLTSDTGSLGG